MWALYQTLFLRYWLFLQLNQIQSTTQKGAEMKEKIRILTNEVEILRQEIINRDQDLVVLIFREDVEASR